MEIGEVFLQEHCGKLRVLVLHFATLCEIFPLHTFGRRYFMKIGPNL